ncbi:MAG: class I SAM-dependent methyltransferase [Syntrophobacteraceae bacterium]|jgi:methyltransferase (TIGR00027 family)
MVENPVSRTALGAAFMRGYHALHDDPKIFDDHLANSLLTKEERSLIAKHLIEMFESIDPSGAATCPDETSALERMLQLWTAAPTILSRARYAEEALGEAVGRGVRQYVILGAGMDTFAFRCRDMLERLQVFEIDHPATQAFKWNRIAGLGWEIPEQLHLVSLDFTNEGLDRILKHSPYDPRALTFFSWLGVTYYLSRETVFDTLSAVAKISPPGSAIVFDYLAPVVPGTGKAAERLKVATDFLQSLGEPLIARFDPSTLEGDLARIGLRLLENLIPSDIGQRYFQGRTDSYRASKHIHFAMAVTK